VPAATASPPGLLDDFPDWVAPVVVKELRQGMRARLFVVPFVAVHLVAVTAVLVEFALFAQIAAAAGGGGGPAPSLAFARGLLWMVAWVVLVIVLPLRGLTSLREEIDGSNFELLAAARQSRWRVVTGKWFVLCAQSWLLFVSLAPYFLVRYFAGSLEVTESLAAAALLLGTNAAANALAIGASGYSGYAARFAVWLGGTSALHLAQSFPGIAILAPFFGGGFAGSDFWIEWAGFAASLLTEALYVLYGLQIARARLRTVLRPFEVPSTGLVLTLIVVTPFMQAIAFACFFLPALVLPLVLAVLVYQLDARPKAVRGTVLPPQNRRT
jgi:hypothetical protein